MNVKLGKFANSRTTVMARFIAITLVLVSIFPFNTATTNAYQYPATVSQKIQSKIFIAPKLAKKVSLRSSLKAANVVPAPSTPNSVCGQYSIDRNQTINVNIISGNGHVDAQNSVATGGSSSINNFVTIAAVPEGPNPVSYVVRNGDCPAFNFVPAAGYQFAYYVFNGGSAQSSNFLKSSRVLDNYTLDVAFSPINCTAIYSAAANGTLSVNGASNLASYTSVFACGQNPDAITAVPNTHYHFLKWDDNNSTANPRQDLNVSSAINASALFQIDTNNISYLADPTMGSISGSTSQIVDYGANGTQVTAIPNAGFHFVKWSDNLTSIARSETNVIGNLTLTAIFAINTYSLTYTADSLKGIIQGAANQTVNYNLNGTEVIALPNIGYHFVKWSDDVATPSRTDLNIKADLAVSAIFAIDTHTVTYSAGSNGSIRGNVSQTVDFNGTGTLVSAIPNAGYHFVEWNDHSTNSSRTESRVISNLTFTAFFQLNPPGQFNIYYRSGGGTGLSPSGPNSYTVGNSFGLPENTFSRTGYDFAGWLENSSNLIYLPNAIFRTASGDVTFTATWNVHNHKITYHSGDGATGVGPTTPNAFEYGNNFELPECKADCYTKPGYVFNGWTDEFGFYKSGDSYSTQDYNVDLTAVWTIESAAVVVNPDVPKVIIKKLPKYKTSYLVWGKAKLDLKFTDVTSNTYHLRVKHDAGTSIRLSDKVLKSIANIFVVKTTNDGIDITAINGWTGKLVLPIISVQNNEEKELNVGAIENPGPVKAPLINLSNINKELISWKKDGSQVIGYVVTNGSKVICKTVKNSCVVKNGSAGKLNIKIQALGRMGTFSTKVVPAVTPKNFVVQFSTASYTLTTESKTILNNLVRIAKLVGANNFEVSGHTDSVGSAALNQKLSENRANAVQKFLRASIRNAKFKVTGFAANVAVASNATATGKASNRRVEIKII